MIFIYRLVGGPYGLWLDLRFPLLGDAQRRVTLRHMFCLHCGKEIPDQSTFCMACGKAIAATSKKPSAWVLVCAVALLLIVVAAGLKYFVDRRPASFDSNPASEAPVSNAPTQPVYVPRAEKLTSGQVTVRAREVYSVRFKVDTSTMNDVRVVGSFRASGGSGNDIEAAIADEDNFENWKNGHEARGPYSSGKTTVGSIDVPIPVSGTYFLGFSNRFSAVSAKFVYADIELRYKVRQ